MVKTISEIRSCVKSRVREKSLKAIIKRVKDSDPSLWGLKKGRNFISHSVLVALYKDLYSVGYCQLKKDVGQWLKITEKSLSKNQKRLRKIFAKWGTDQINTGDYSDWERAKKNVKFKKPVKELQLFIDSSDFRLTGKRVTSKKDPSWSYKENGPAQRFMTICDAQARVRFLRGGYTPKLFPSGRARKIVQESDF